MSTFAAAMDNSGKEAEAMALLAEAERKVKNSQSFFSGLFGGSSKIEEACEIYARAANMFKMAKNWSAAGNAFCQAAQLHLQLQSKHDAATCFVDAGNAFKKADPQEAINCLMRAIEIYTDMGRFTIAAKHHISIAEIYETELVDIEKAIAHYEQSADYYKGEESNSSANKCLLKVAGYAAQLEQYQKAIDIYEQVGTNAMDSPLLKYSAKDYFFKAALCHFCIDMLNAKLAVQKYEELFPAFSDSRECKLMKVKIVGSPRGTERGQLHRGGEGVRRHLQAGPVAHHHAAAHQEDDPGRRGGPALGPPGPLAPVSLPRPLSPSLALQ
ncbi:alpha-soluble NSF attachment protein isoform X1 [Balaenoptera musculus]|uniref:Alpha-soluble NSF attachment protein isoform X1 n=1 Tax=Balaenoptera musculus TaxID=9771 RepID=A0A8B8VWX8_BALMU|nr:alpha-soluble NSF attachment protein isoform X1 [Balaenoptera musculus]